MNKNEIAYQQLIKGIQNYIEERLNNIGYDKTYTAIVKGVGIFGYQVLLNGQLYNNVNTIGGTCTINETVKVVVPQNNLSNMFILKGGTSGSERSGSGDVSSANGQVGDVVLTTSDVGAISTTQTNVTNGVVGLNESDIIDSNFLPSHVDDVIEGIISDDLTSFTKSGVSSPSIPEAEDSQTLDDTEKENARNNIGDGTSNFRSDYDISTYNLEIERSKLDGIS